MVSLCVSLFLMPALAQVEVKRGYCYDTARSTAEIINDENSELYFIKPRYRRSFANGSYWHVVVQSGGVIYDLERPEHYRLEHDYFEVAFGEPVLLRRISAREIKEHDTLWIATLFDEGPWETR